MSFIVCLKDISVMRISTTIAGLSCIFCLLLCVWRFFDGAYDIDSGIWGRNQNVTDGWQSDGSYVPVHDTHNLGFDDLMGYTSNALRVVASQSVVFLFHFNTAKYFRELEYPKKDKYIHGV